MAKEVTGFNGFLAEVYSEDMYKKNSYHVSVFHLLVLTLRMTDLGGKKVGPYRVWLGEAQLLGLAMSRSLGDTLAHSVGVSPKPEVRDLSLLVDSMHHDVAKLPTISTRVRLGCYASSLPIIIYICGR